MGKNKYVQHNHIKTTNNNGDEVEVFHHKHYSSEGYQVTKVNGKDSNSNGAWETLENAVNSTNK